MGDVVNIGGSDKSITGEAKCVQCQKEWIAVAPVGTVTLDCPDCNTMKGAFVGMTCPDEFWVCNCGNDLFFISKEGCMCANCGITPTF